MATVFHKSWIKRNAFGGFTTTTQCNRNSYRGQSSGMNIADTDAEVTCKFCLKIMEAGLVRPSFNEGEVA